MTRDSIQFNANDRSTLGVEVELALVDAETMALCSAMPRIQERLPQDMQGKIKPELMQCYVEVNTEICHTVAEAEQDLRHKIGVLESVAGGLGVRLLWSGTHPFSNWRDQKVSDNERYHGLLNLLQDTARQLVTFGLHVHVGVDSGDKSVMMCDRMLNDLPMLLALSCNSPFWEGRNTGLGSWRSKIMNSLPTAGLPPLMRNWSEYVWLINHLIETGYIDSIREIWWDVRPHYGFGTVEVRICDIPGTLDDTMALVALTQCLVKYLSNEIDRGTYQQDFHPMLARQNKWRAARYGLDAKLVESPKYAVQSVRTLAQNMVSELMRIAEELDCVEYLERVRDIAARPTWADQQIAHLQESGDPVDVVRRMTQRSRLTPLPSV